MPNYTVQDSQTGKTVTFAWNGDEPPTQADMSQVFAAARASSPARPQKTREDFINETGTLPTRIKETALNVARNASPYVRPLLEGGGAIAGGTIAGAAATPETLGLATAPAAIAGTALGYASGKNLADTYDEALGLKKPESLIQRFATTGQDLATGATLEMGGQVAGKAIGAGLNRFARARAEGLPFTSKNNTAKAAQIWDDVTAATPESAAANTTRQASTEDLLGRVGTEAKPTPGQMTGNLKTAGFEQSTAAKDPALMEKLKYNDAQLAADAQKNMTGALGPAAAPLPVTPANGQAVGASIDSAITAAKEPVVAAERAAWDAVPNYAMPHDNFSAAAAELSKAPMVKSTADALTGHNGILHFAEQMPKTVQGLQSIERTISSEIGKAAKAGDNETARTLGILKSAIGADFDAMGTAAANGDIALHEGQLVYPSKIQTEITNLQNRLATEQAAAQTTPDVAAIQDALRSAGDPPNVWMKQVNESPTQHATRMIARYQQKVGGDIPVVGTAESANAAAVKERIGQLQGMLSNLQPAEDVAQTYAAAKQLSKVEKFDRFDRGAVKEVLAKGNEATGRRLPLEAIPAKMFTPRGSADLVKALTPMQGAGMTAAQARVAGVKAAGEQMLPHVMENLSAARIIDPDGVMNIPRAMAYLRQNKETLNNLGLTQQVQQMIKEQIPGSVKATLDRMADKGVDVLGNPTMTARQAAKLWRDHAPAWKAAGGDPRALQAMRDYHSVITMLNRNKGVSYSGNSTSIEKLFGDAPVGSLGRKLVDNLSGAIIGGGTGAAIGGPVGAAVGGTAGLAAKTTLDTAVKHSAEAVKALLKDAITNPETAQMLMKVAKGLKVPAKEIDSRLATLGVYAAGKAISGTSQPTAYTYQNGELIPQ